MQIDQMLMQSKELGPNLALEELALTGLFDRRAKGKKLACSMNRMQDWPNADCPNELGVLDRPNADCPNVPGVVDCPKADVCPKADADGGFAGVVEGEDGCPKADVPNAGDAADLEFEVKGEADGVDV